MPCAGVSWIGSQTTSVDCPMTRILGTVTDTPLRTRGVGSNGGDRARPSASRTTDVCRSILLPTSAVSKSVWRVAAKLPNKVDKIVPAL